MLTHNKDIFNSEYIRDYLIGEVTKLVLYMYAFK